MGMLSTISSNISTVTTETSNLAVDLVTLGRSLIPASSSIQVKINDAIRSDASDEELEKLYKQMEKAVKFEARISKIQ